MTNILTEQTIEDFLITFYVRQFQGVWGTQSGFRTTVDTDTIQTDQGDRGDLDDADAVFLSLAAHNGNLVLGVWGWRE